MIIQLQGIPPFGQSSNNKREMLVCAFFSTRFDHNYIYIFCSSFSKNCTHKEKKLLPQNFQIRIFERHAPHSVLNVHSAAPRPHQVLPPPSVPLGCRAPTYPFGPPRPTYRRAITIPLRATLACDVSVSVSASLYADSNP